MVGSDAVALGHLVGLVLGWVNAPGLNVEVIRYEDLQACSRETFSRAACFLQLLLDTERSASAVVARGGSSSRRVESGD